MNNNIDNLYRNQSAEDMINNDGTLVSGAPYWAPRELSDEYSKTEVKRQGVDQPFLILTLLLLMVGLIMVLSASFARGAVTNKPLSVFISQIVFTVIGLSSMILISLFTAKTMSRWAYLLLVFSIFLLVIVLYVGSRVNGAKRWIGLKGFGGSLSFQPSEIAKLAIIMAGSKWICDVGPKKMKTFRHGILPFLGICVVIVFLLFREPHLSASIVVVVLTGIMMFAGGVKLRWFVVPAFILLIGFGIVAYVAINDNKNENDGVVSLISKAQFNIGKVTYADNRLNAWLDPEATPLGEGYQIRQSLYAVGSGGILGQGLGQSRQKYLYLPEEHNDYIFAIVCEELGFIGAILILMLFALLVVRGFWLALHAKDRYSALITTGISSLLAIQVFLNIAVVTNLIPATGVSLPFFSYGGTALSIQLLQVGIILAVSREIPQVKRGRKIAG